MFVLSGALMVSIQPHKSITICQNLLEINCAGKTEMKGTLHLTSQCHRVEYLGLFLFNYVRRHSQYATVKGHILKDRAIHWLHLCHLKSILECVLNCKHQFTHSSSAAFYLQRCKVLSRTKTRPSYPLLSIAVPFLTSPVSSICVCDPLLVELTLLPLFLVESHVSTVHSTMYRATRKQLHKTHVPLSPEI